MIQEAPLYGGQLSRRVTIRDLKMAKQRSERWPMLTSYDMYTAEVFDEAGIPVLLVGDSAANNVYGHADTVPVTVDELIPLARAVVRSTRRALVVGDLPFGSYQVGPEQALETAIRFMKEAGVQAIKLEGGVPVAPAVRRIVDAGIPVMGHVGFTPQSVNALGGYRAGPWRRRPAGAGRGEGARACRSLRRRARNGHQRGGATSHQCLVDSHDRDRSGPDCDAQVLVWQDMAGLRTGRLPKFVKTYGNLRGTLLEATKAFASDVVSGSFPDDEHSYR